MKDFLKFTLATVVGIIVATVILFFGSILTLFGLAASSESETQVSEHSVMTLHLDGVLQERSQAANPLAMLTGEDDGPFGLDDVLASVRKAKEHEHIEGIYIEAGMLSAGLASLEELRAALADFKESGKFIAAYGDNYTQGAYYVASVADRLMLNPQGIVDWHGLASTPIYFKDLLQKVGVEAQVFKVGTYKSAVEPWIANGMSQADREQVTSYVTAIWDKYVADVSASRSLSAEQLNHYADLPMGMQPATMAVEAGMADTLVYKNDVRDCLKRLAGVEDDDDLHLLSLADMVNVRKNVPKDKSGNIVAVYYAEGTINDMAPASPIDDTPLIRASKVIKDLKRLQEDDDVKAVVLRINSPGGSAYDSEQMWYAVEQLKQEKPVIVSMGDYAASGGYYIACNADTIVAQATTLTGSIGIYGLFYSGEKLADKLGVDFDMVKTNEFADFGAMYRPMNATEQALMQQHVERGYHLFLSRCAEGRGMDKAELDPIAQGRVWTGAQARELGLVDEIGGLDRALQIAVDKAGIDSYTVMAYPAKQTFLETLMDSGAGSLVKAALPADMGMELCRQLEFVRSLTSQDRLQARMPFNPNIN